MIQQRTTSIALPTNSPIPQQDYHCKDWNFLVTTTTTTTKSLQLFTDLFCTGPFVIVIKHSFFILKIYPFHIT